MAKMVGQVIRVIAGFYDVQVGDNLFRIRGSGRLRNDGVSPLVGDWVNFDPNGALESIMPRRNTMLRPKVANVDFVAIVASVTQPSFSSYMINKMLALVEYQNITPLVIFTKVDLASTTTMPPFSSYGYQVFTTSIFEKFINHKLVQTIDGKLVVFTGQSGVGKTSLINSITGLNRATQAISHALGRGKHTTRVVEIVAFGRSGIIDTPGFSSLVFPLTKRQTASAFAEYRLLAATCKFKSCLHQHEPAMSCAVKMALASGQTDNVRYNDYLRLLEEASDA